MFVCPECGESFGEQGFCTRDGTRLGGSGGDPVLGQSIGQFRVAGLLGIGGIGRVYKGVNPTIASRVAIKVLSRDCADSPDLVERFFAEALAVPASVGEFWMIGYLLIRGVRRVDAPRPELVTSG